MAEIKSYRDLFVWEEAMNLVTDIYSLSRSFPREEIYCLTNQLRRAGISIPSNIAEGQARGSTREFHHHLLIARGSLAEAETQILIAERLDYIHKESIAPVWNKAQDVGRMLNGLIRSLHV